MEHKIINMAQQIYENRYRFNNNYLCDTEISILEAAEYIKKKRSVFVTQKNPELTPELEMYLKYYKTDKDFQ